MKSAFVAVALAAALVGCGKEIGDECILDSDCDPNGTRDCDRSQKGGYCTVQGCDYDTCPEDSTCIRFFTGGFENRPCDGVDDCSLDELCSLEGLCVPRNSESRYCMATCSDDGDCRDGYECRTRELMIEHGGEPVLEPNNPDDKVESHKFCAIKPA